MNEHAPGTHLLIDYWDCKNITDVNLIEDVLKEAAKACNATILETKLHSFGKDSGVTGVVILAESHISIHTWPELSYAAIDIFMCGASDPAQAIPILNNFFQPQKTKIKEIKRGEQNE